MKLVTNASDYIRLIGNYFKIENCSFQWIPFVYKLSVQCSVLKLRPVDYLLNTLKNRVLYTRV
eukprot:UN08730